MLFRSVRQPYTAAVLTTLTLTVGLFAPLFGVGWILSRELLAMGEGVVANLREGGLDRIIDALDAPRITSALHMIGLSREELSSSLADGVQRVSLSAAGGLASSLPDVVTQSAVAALDVVVFFFSVVTLLARGPDLLAWIDQISPLDRHYQQRLFEVFTTFARNVVLAGAVCGVLQGVVATIGYAMVGIERPFVFGLLTGALTYVPFVGTALVWIPLTAQLALAGSWGKAAFVLGWSVLVTASVDNFVRPLIVRGQTGIHPLLILLGVFGGLRALGIVGILIGPVFVAMLVTLLTIYTEEVRARRDTGSG